MVVELLFATQGQGTVVAVLMQAVIIMTSMTALLYKAAGCYLIEATSRSTGCGGPSKVKLRSVG